MKVKNRNIILLLLLITFVLFGCKGKKATKKEEKIKVVNGSRAVIKEISKKIVISGNLDSFNEVNHSSDSGGDIKKVYVGTGTRVKKGDKIIELENDMVKTRYEQAQAQYIAAKATYEQSNKFAEDQMLSNLQKAKLGLVSAEMNLSKAEKGAKQEQLDQLNYQVESAYSNYNVAKQNYKKTKKLYDKKLVSEQNFLQAQLGFETSEAGYKSAKKQLEIAEKGADIEDINTLKAVVEDAKFQLQMLQKMVDQKNYEYDIQRARSQMLMAESGLQSAEKSYKDLLIKAEIDGIIINLEKKENEKIGPGKSLFQIINDKDMIMEVGIDEKDINDINKGKKANIFIASLNKEFKGEVYEINPTADERTRKYNTKIRVKNTEFVMKQGMYGRATIFSGTTKGLVVPKVAIIVEGLNNVVYKLEDGSNMVNKISVILGEEDEKNIEIITEEIKENQIIITEGQFILNDNDKVELKEVK